MKSFELVTLDFFLIKILDLVTEDFYLDLTSPVANSKSYGLHVLLFRSTYLNGNLTFGNF